MALGNVVARLLVRLGLDKKEFDAGAASVKAETQKLKGSLNDVRGATDLLTGALKGAGVLGMAYMAREAASAVWDLAKLGAEAERMETSFDNLAGRIETTGDELLKTLRRTSVGTVSDMDLMRITAGLLASGIQTSSQDIADAMEIARLKAQQFGISTTEAYERMVTGARKFSVEMLDEIGVNLKAESVYRRRADALGINVKALNDTQRAEALWLAILEDGRDELQRYGPAIGDAVDNFDSLEASITNLKTEWGQLIDGPMAQMAVALTDTLGNISAGNAIIEAATNGTLTWGEAMKGLARYKEIYSTAGKEAAEEYVQELIRTGEEVGSVQRALEAVGRQQQLLADAKLFGSDKQIEYYREELRKVQAEYDALPAVIEQAEAASRGWMVSLGTLPGYVDQASSALGDHFNILDKIGRAYTALQGLPQQVLDLAPPKAMEAWDILLRERENAEQEWLENSIRRLHGFADENEDVAAEVASTWDDTYNEMRSAVEAALSPTSVTAWDMHLTAMGQYTDKWDENARRLDAIAQGGFSALQEHPDWASILKIPEEVMAAGEASLKEWAARTSEDVRNLFRPDLLNVDAAADAVERYMQEQAAKELSIDLVIGELVARGGMTQADAEAQVRQAYGLETEAVDIPINLVSAVAGDEGEGWSAAAEELVGGLKDAISDSSIVSEFVGYMRKDIEDNAALLSNAGKSLWNSVEVGILVRLDRADYAAMFVSKLGPLVGAWLLENSTVTQGGGEP